MHDAGAVSRDIVAIDLGGGGVRSLVAGSDFLAFPRLSPDGTRIAWIAWNHPQMPWDGTELREASLADPSSWTVLLGSTEESVMQPEWIDDESLYVISDRSGWWNLYSVTLDGSVTPLVTLDADFGAPLWRLGSSWYSVLEDGKLLTVRTVGTDTLAVLDRSWPRRPLWPPPSVRSPSHRQHRPNRHPNPSARSARWCSKARTWW